MSHSSLSRTEILQYIVRDELVYVGRQQRQELVLRASLTERERKSSRSITWQLGRSLVPPAILF
jgi:hypothetical protein